VGTFIKLQDQLIRLKEQNSQQITTPAKAVNEAIEFCIANKLTECELDYDGFLFDIEPTSDLREKLNDYYRTRGGSLIEDSNCDIPLVTASTFNTMEKLKRTFKVDYYLDWEYGVEISKLREDLDAIEKLGATHVEIDSSISYDCAYTTIEAISERIETDEEQKERLDKEQRRKDDIERRELEQLNKLKEKYGK